MNNQIIRGQVYALKIWVESICASFDESSKKGFEVPGRLSANFTKHIVQFIPKLSIPIAAALLRPVDEVSTVIEDKIVFPISVKISYSGKSSFDYQIRRQCKRRIRDDLVLIPHYHVLNRINPDVRLALVWEQSPQVNHIYPVRVKRMSRAIPFRSDFERHTWNVNYCFVHIWNLLYRRGLFTKEMNNFRMIFLRHL